MYLFFHLIIEIIFYITIVSCGLNGNLMIHRFQYGIVHTKFNVKYFNFRTDSYSF